MNTENQQCKNKHCQLKETGGIQRHFRKNEAQIYMAKFTLDVANYCFEDFNDSSLSSNELDCARRLAEMNNKLLNLN